MGGGGVKDSRASELKGSLNDDWQALTWKSAIEGLFTSMTDDGLEGVELRSVYFNDASFCRFDEGQGHFQNAIFQSSGDAFRRDLVADLQQ